MNYIYCFILLVTVFVTYVWYKRWQHYRNLSVLDRLHEDHFISIIKNTGFGTAQRRLSDHICGQFRKAESFSALVELDRVLTLYKRNRPFSIRNGTYGPFNTIETHTCFEEVATEFEEEFNRESKKSEEETASKEVEWLKTAQEASTWEELNKVLEGNNRNSDSRNLAIKKMNLLSLHEVLSVSTLEELAEADSRAQSGSLAKQFVPFMHEHISMSAMKCARSEDDIISLAENAPTTVLNKSTPLYVAFIKLHRQFQRGKWPSR